MEKKKTEKKSTGKKLLMFIVAIPVYYIVKDVYHRMKNKKK